MENPRIRCNWGGFTIVNATLHAMRYGWNLHRHFDYLVDLSGTSYPIKSNEVIRQTLAEKPDALYFDLVREPNVPQPGNELYDHDTSGSSLWSS